jgi:hypothetical protein
MMQVPAAGVQYSDPVLQQFHLDSLEGCCTMEIVATETKTIQDKIKDLGRPGQYSVTQTHLVHICYSDPELEFERRLSV